MPHPATLAELGALAYAALAADGVGAKGLPVPDLAVAERAAQLGGSAAAGLVVMVAAAAAETAADSGAAATRAAARASDAADDPEATGGGRGEAQLIRHAAAALRLPHAEMAATPDAVLPLLALACRRATRALRTMQTHAERTTRQAAIARGKRGALAGESTPAFVKRRAPPSMTAAAHPRSPSYPPGMAGGPPRARPARPAAQAASEPRLLPRPPAFLPPPQNGGHLARTTTRHVAAARTREHCGGGGARD